MEVEVYLAYTVDRDIVVVMLDGKFYRVDKKHLTHIFGKIYKINAAYLKEQLCYSTNKP